MLKIYIFMLKLVSQMISVITRKDSLMKQLTESGMKSRILADNDQAAP